MEKIIINHESGTKEYIVYEKEEADAAGVDYVPWREAEVGKHVLTDDGLVAEVIKWTRYSSSPRGDKDKHYIRCPWGAAFVFPHIPTQLLKGRGRKNKYDVSGKLTKVEKEMTSSLMKNMAMVYAMTMNQEKTLNHVYPEATRQEYRQLKRKMCTKVFRDMVRQELREHLDAAGINEAKALTFLKEIVEIAKEKKDVTNMMRAFENMKSILGMEQREKQTTTLQVTAGSNRKLIDMLNDEEAKLTLTHKVEKDVQVEETDEDLGREVVEAETIEDVSYPQGDDE